MNDPLLRVLAILAVWAVSSLAALFAVGLHPVIPADFLIAVAFLIPLAWALHGAIGLAGTFTGRPLWALGLLCGGLYLTLDPNGTRAYGVTQAVFTVGFLVMVLPKRIPESIGSALLGVAGVGIGTIGVWSSQYLALLVARGRLLDGPIAAVDQGVYTALFGHPVAFPLVNVGTVAFHVLQSGYVFLFTETALIAFRLGSDRARLATFLARMFACYALATLIFAVLPVAGPYLGTPDVMRSGLDGTIIGSLVTGGQQEFRAMLDTGQPLTGYGVFVGFPSLHIALIVLFQWTLMRDRIAFWAVLLPNLAAAIATVAFGFHYLIDLPAGALLAVAVIATIGNPQVSSRVVRKISTGAPCG